jgi:hypothetical protein
MSFIVDVLMRSTAFLDDDDDDDDEIETVLRMVLALCLVGRKLR